MAGIARDLGTAIIRLMAAFPDDRRDTKLTLGVYADGLSGIDHELITRAVARAVRELKHFPSVADIREFCDTERINIALEGKRPVVDDGPPFVAWSKEGVGLRREGESDEVMIWRMRVRFFRSPTQTSASRKNPHGYWAETWGPKPTEEGCRAPREILLEFGFAPVIETRSKPTQQDIDRVRAIVAGLEPRDQAAE